MNHFNHLRIQIAKRISRARHFCGRRKADLAGRSGIPLRRYNACEKTGDLRCNELEAIAAAVNLPPSHFLAECVLCGSSIEMPSELDSPTPYNS